MGVDRLVQAIEDAGLEFEVPAHRDPAGGRLDRRGDEAFGHRFDAGDETVAREGGEDRARKVFKLFVDFERDVVAAGWRRLNQDEGAPPDRLQRRLEPIVKADRVWLPGLEERGARLRQGFDPAVVAILVRDVEVVLNDPDRFVPDKVVLRMRDRERILLGNGNAAASASEQNQTAKPLDEAKPDLHYPSCWACGTTSDDAPALHAPQTIFRRGSRVPYRIFLISRKPNFAIICAPGRQGSAPARNGTREAGVAATAFETETYDRWRLILGPQAHSAGSVFTDRPPLAGDLAELDQALTFLAEAENRLTGPRERGASGERSTLSAPTWLASVRRLFPRSTAERLTRLALERYRLTELLADETVLASVTPDLNLLRALLAAKSFLPAHLTGMVRRLVRRVVEQLMERLASRIRRPFFGVADPNRPSNVPLARNFDAPKTLRRNLRHYDPQTKRLGIERPYFRSRHQHHGPWDIFVVVDQSGSMLDSVIHATVLAAIFHSLPSIRVQLIAFDTSVVDLTEHVSDPVEVLLRTQLGGGTDIGQALGYVERRIARPRRSLVVLITDFYEGGSAGPLCQVTARLSEAGVILLGLAALDERAEPAYHRALARKLSRLGMRIAAMTPDQLADWVAREVRA